MATKSRLVRDDVGRVYQIYDRDGIWRGYRIGVVFQSAKRAKMFNAGSRIFDVISDSPNDYACNEHGRQLELRDHPFNLRRKLKDRVPYFACPVPECTVAKWHNGKDGTPADQITRSARKALMDLMHHAIELHGVASDDVTAYLLDFTKVCGSLGLKNFQECADGMAAFWEVASPVCQRIAESDKCKGILRNYGISTEVVQVVMPPRGRDSAKYPRPNESGRVIVVDVSRDIEL